jgi:hypothetical protein
MPRKTACPGRGQADGASCTLSKERIEDAAPGTLRDGTRYLQ